MVKPRRFRPEPQICETTPKIRKRATAADVPDRSDGAAPWAALCRSASVHGPRWQHLDEPGWRGLRRQRARTSRERIVSVPTPKIADNRTNTRISVRLSEVWCRSFPMPPGFNAPPIDRWIESQDRFRKVSTCVSTARISCPKPRRQSARPASRRRILEVFDFNLQPNIDRKTIGELTSWSFVQRGEDVIFPGRRTPAVKLYFSDPGHSIVSRS